MSSTNKDFEINQAIQHIEVLSQSLAGTIDFSFDGPISRSDFANQVLFSFIKLVRAERRPWKSIEAHAKQNPYADAAEAEKKRMAKSLERTVTRKKRF